MMELPQEELQEIFIKFSKVLGLILQHFCATRIASAEFRA